MNDLDYMQQELIKPCPCDSCELYYKCKKELLACKSFFSYVHSGRIVWNNRNPTRKIWQKIYVEDGDDAEESKQKIKALYKEMK